MLFKLHEEKAIGYKKISDAELGRRPSSHQTHIGLYEDILTFLPHSSEIDDAMMIYEGNIEYLVVNFDWIQSSNAKQRSPKIRTGGQNSVSVVSFIRDQAKALSPEIDWYLFWFGLENEQPVFFLFNSDSRTFLEINELGFRLDSIRRGGRLSVADDEFFALLNYLESAVNEGGNKVAKELEVLAQSDTSYQKTKVFKPRTFDIDRAKEIYSEIGRNGEILVNDYFEDLFRNGLIDSFEWCNRDKESGLPFDFHYQEKDGSVRYLDVKTTGYDFNQAMIFSDTEITFASEVDNPYDIYRVYGDEKNFFLRICRNSKGLLSTLNKHIELAREKFPNNNKIMSLKISVIPSCEDLRFSEPVKFNK